MNQRIRRAVMSRLGLVFDFEFRNNALSQHLAELNAPLVERVYVPDHALGEDTMLIKRNELAQGIWCQLLDQNCVRRVVAFENTVWKERIDRAFSFDFLRRFTEGQCFGLGK